MTTHPTSTAPRRAIIEPPPEPSPPPRLGDGADWLRALDWRAFERLVADAFRRQGFAVLPTAHGADGGIDLILNRGAERIFVQCKHWRSYQVGVSVVRELFGLVAAYRATGGIVVTSGRFTPEAVEFARVSGVVLLDGPAVTVLTAAGLPNPQPTVLVPASTGAWVAAPAPASGSQAWPAPRRSQRVKAPARPAPRPAKASTAPPACPICAAPMVQRKARRGPEAGSRFWGCSRFPGCKGVREIAGRSPSDPQSHWAPTPKPTFGRVVNRLSYRVAQVATIVIGIWIAVTVLYGVLLAMVPR
jgi:restriction system protein